jgi:hypothetical protein
MQRSNHVDIRSCVKLAVFGLTNVQNAGVQLQKELTTVNS